MPPGFIGDFPEGASWGTVRGGDETWSLKEMEYNGKINIVVNKEYLSDGPAIASMVGHELKEIELVADFVKNDPNGTGTTLSNNIVNRIRSTVGGKRSNNPNSFHNQGLDEQERIVGDLRELLGIVAE